MGATVILIKVKPCDALLRILMLCYALVSKIILTIKPTRCTNYSNLFLE